MADVSLGLGRQIQGVNISQDADMEVQWPLHHCLLHSQFSQKSDVKFEVLLKKMILALSQLTLRV